MPNDNEAVAVESANGTPQTVRTETVTVTKRKVVVFKGTVAKCRTGGPVGHGRMTGGVRIRMQSTVLEDFFKANATAGYDEGDAAFTARNMSLADGGQMKGYRLNGTGLDLMRQAGVTTGEVVRFDQWQETSALLNGRNELNLSLLRVVGLGAGVDVIVPAQHTKVIMRKWMEAANRVADYIYREWNKPYAFKITTTSEEIA